MRQCSDIYCDGTFRTCPKPYEQYFTIHGHGKYRSRVLCFVNCLMTDRNITDYRHVFQTLKTKICQVTGHRWRPRGVICDFEQALLVAVETELHHAQISGCYFHFNQSLWRKVQNLGLTASYRQHRELKKVIRKVMAIGYLPVLLVRQNFHLLRTSRRIMRLCRRFPKLTDFLELISMKLLKRQWVVPSADVECVW